MFHFRHFVDASCQCVQTNSSQRFVKTARGLAATLRVIKERIVHSAIGAVFAVFSLLCALIGSCEVGDGLLGLQRSGYHRALVWIRLEVTIILGNRLRIGVVPLAVLLCGSNAYAADLPTLPGPAVPGALNPAVTQASISTTICVRGWSKKVRPPASFTGRLKREQLQAFGYTGQLADVEEDHRVPIAVGGAPWDPKNLWPEPRHVAWGAEKKDRLEDLIHGLVCDGRLSLVDGQAVFFGNWQQAAKRYGIDP